MKLPLIAVIILSISLTLALDYGQTAWGNGELSSRVDIVGAKESVQATGEHKHIIYLETAKENSRLDSIYRLDTANVTNETLEKHGYFEPNSYMFSLNRIDSIWHQTEVHSIGDISSTNTAKYGPKGASTDFNVSAEKGTIEERVESYWDYRMGLPIHGHPIVQTSVNGSMGIRSQLNDDKILGKPTTDADMLRESLESVDLIGETARRELQVNKAKVIVEDREINLVDFGSIPKKKMQSLLENTSPEREIETPNVLQEGLAQLGITDAKIVSESSSPDTSDEDSLIDAFERLNDSEKAKLKIKQSAEKAFPDKESICSINSEIASNANTSSSNETSSSNIINDSWRAEPPLKLLEGVGVDASTFNAAGEGDDQILETEDTIFVVNTLWPTLEEMFPINKTRESFRLGGSQQRLGTAFVGRKVRTDGYFSEEKVPINISTLRQANTTRSTVLTDPGRL